MFRRRSWRVAMLANMPCDADGYPDQQDRTKNENAEENSHRGEDNKGGDAAVTGGICAGRGLR